MVKLVEFIKGIFGASFSEGETHPLFCGFPDDPQTCKNWQAKVARHGSLPKSIKKNHNCYFTACSFKPTPEGDFSKKDKFFDTAFAVVIDDVGTKVKSELLVLPCSWKVRTSPKNFQVGYILDEPCTDLQLIKDITDALASKGFTDPGAKGGTRWVRLPYGVNTKAEYVDDGDAPTVSLVEWHPERQYSIEQFDEAYKLDVVGKNASARCKKDSVLTALIAADLYKGRLEPGKHDITCPWVKKHTSEKDHGSVYFEPGPENGQQGGFKCQHGHCSHRSINDLKEFLGLAAGEKKKPAEVAMEFVQDFSVFRDEHGEPIVFLNGNCLPVKNKEVKAQILSHVFMVTGKHLKSQVVSEVISALEGRAICEGQKIKLELRIAKYKGWFLYDLGDGRVVRVKKDGWDIIGAPPIFRRYAHQQIQVEPVRGGNPWDIFDFMNIKPEHQLETLVLLISYLVPEIAHPVFHPHGAHGSGKTTLCSMVKALLDPSSLSVMIAPKNKQELIRQINRHHVSLFDNMSKLDSEMSDIICITCTGGSVAKRALWTDDDDCIFSFKRCIGLNGINLLISKPDLLDRSMLLHLERIQEKERKLETKLLTEFSKARPEILGGMFDILSKAKSLYSGDKPKNKPRLADFATWGYAIAEAIEEGNGKKFVTAYKANIRRQNTEVLQHNSLCIAVVQLMKSKSEWEGTIKQAYEKLYEIVEPARTDGTFPDNPRQLSKYLERIQATLEEAVGIKYHLVEQRKNNGFHIIFTKE